MIYDMKGQITEQVTLHNHLFQSTFHETKRGLETYPTFDGKRARPGLLFESSVPFTISKGTSELTEGLHIYLRSAISTASEHTMGWWAELYSQRSTAPAARKLTDGISTPISNLLCLSLL